jgi:uncharacterized membrane protein
MALLILGLVLFFGLHTLPMLPSLREPVHARLGERGYKMAFGILSALGLLLIIVGFAQLRGSGQDVQLWSPPGWTRHVAFALMLPALILMVAAYAPSRIRELAGYHPLLLGIMVWALAHLIANGDLAGLLLFGGFLVWAIADRISTGERGDLGPLGRKPGTLTGDIIAVVIGCALYAIILKWGHQFIAGVPLTG